MQMRKIRLFIAMSLDGYIADSKGGVDWLVGQGNDDENIDSYSSFVKDIDTILMGWNTYYHIITELSAEKWVYDEFISYVITHKKCVSCDNIRFTDESPVELVKKLREEDGKDVWICGGANLIQQLVMEDLIDYYYITIIPTILGSGIRLFENTKYEIRLRLLSTRSYNGMTDLIYTRR
nr:dihydrofolate reductase family protein [uncultured Helicobacter sp.]